MANKYDTRVLKAGSLTVTVSKEAKSPGAGDRLEAFLKILASILGGLKPDNTLPGGGTAPGKPDNTLPGSQPGIDNSLPEPPTAPPDPVYPDNSLPGVPPTAGQLPVFIGDNAGVIAKIILGHCIDCNTAQPKK